MIFKANKILHCQNQYVTDVLARQSHFWLADQIKQNRKTVWLRVIMCCLWILSLAINSSSMGQERGGSQGVLIFANPTNANTQTCGPQLFHKFCLKSAGLHEFLVCFCCFCVGFVVWRHFTIEKMPQLWWSVWARKSWAPLLHEFFRDWSRVWGINIPVWPKYLQYSSVVFCN